MDVLARDLGLESHQCGAWTRIGDAHPVATKTATRAQRPDHRSVLKQAQRSGLATDR